ncbi:hypothetical protein [Tychonema sp. BBK16]|uniref:hypothetical protein n=1 Tax=Tychonema sp. BBK16 TaxID=2699888 RepID=UPI001F39DAFE|nr:hypothetical protein [Tychonema sp. BBK16]MCF6371625.1 hypothetical protein [Tychonema sp. BBK16]
MNVVFGHWALGIGHWASGIGALGIGHGEWGIGSSYDSKLETTIWVSVTSIL